MSEPASFLNGKVVLHAGDSRDVLKSIADCSIDSVVTDPPYALVSIVKRFGGDNAAPVKMDDPEKSGCIKAAYARASAGFMGKQWDTGETAFAVEFWAEIMRVLKPGGHVVAFSGTRTYHRLAVAIEDAGFEIRDQLAWVYGSGFPKSHDVSKGIDKLDAAAERRRRNLVFTAWMRGTGITAAAINAATDSFMGSHYLTDREQAAVPTEDMFSLLRPLLPPAPPEIEALVAERTVESANFNSREVIDRSANGIAGGSGELVAGNLASAGFKAEFDITAPATDDARQWQGWGTALKPAWEPIVMARKPLAGTVAANVLEHGTGALNIDECRVGTDGETFHAPQSDPSKREGVVGSAMQATGGIERNQAAQRASIERTATLGRWPANIVHDGSDEVVACFPETHSAGAAGYTKTREAYDASNMHVTGGSLFRIGDNGGSAARFFYSAKADKHDRLGSKHPTVKPVDLMQWLCRLVTPPGGTVLDPFAGSGSTGEAAWREGFQCVLIEREPEYQADIARRMQLAMAGPDERQRESIKAKTAGKPMDLGPLFGEVA